MPRGPNIPGHSDRRTESLDELFFNDRLNRDYVSKRDYPARIDQAAIDLKYGVTIGRSKYDAGAVPTGGLITEVDFDRATGTFYREGLLEIATEVSDIGSNLDRYSDQEIGRLAFRLNEIRYQLQELGEADDVDLEDIVRVIEAIVEKLRTRSMHDADAEVVGHSLHNPETVSDTVFQMLSDPSLAGYADELLAGISDSPGGRSLLAILDAPEMVTPLWDHQRKALAKWIETDKHGYVDMATATGKTVLGLAAIAAEYGRLHPVDEGNLESTIGDVTDETDTANILIVAGQSLILEQWRSEFDEHLDIPRDRTRTEETDHGKRISLEWGTIDFKTAQQLLQTDTLGRYDLVILDEAHRYSRGSQSGRGWGAVFDDLLQSAEGILAMSGSVDQGWSDRRAKNALEDHLTKCFEFTVPEARAAGVIADFSWEIRYCAAAQSTSQADLIDRTETLLEAYDSEDYRFELERLDSELSTADITTFETPSEIQSFAQSKAGKALREQSTTFDRFATAAIARRTHRWQLSPPETTVADLVEAHTPESKVVVLVQSYAQAEAVSEEIKQAVGEELVVVPDADGDDQFETITNFTEGEYRVIVGPGHVLGMGVDMPQADVAINISKGGVNASLIQRIGRVLRNPTGDKQATYYQIVTLPSEDRAYLDGPDGRRMLQRAAEFRALGTRLRQLPAYVANEQVTARRIGRLETAGAQSIQSSTQSISDLIGDEIAQEHLAELLERDELSDGESSRAVLLNRWTAKTLDQAPVHDDDDGSIDADRIETEAEAIEAPATPDAPDGSPEPAKSASSTNISKEATTESQSRGGDPVSKTAEATRPADSDTVPHQRTKTKASDEQLDPTGSSFIHTIISSVKSLLGRGSDESRPGADDTDQVPSESTDSREPEVAPSPSGPPAMDETKNDEVTDSNRSEEGQEGDQLVFNWVDETSEGNQSEIGEGLNPPGEQEQSVEGIEFRTGGSDAEPAGEMENASQQSDKDLSATQDESNEEKNAELPNENSPERDELLEELQSVSMRVGMPVFRFNMKDVGRFDPGAYEEEFGSWDAALQAAGLNESEDEDSVETESEDRSHEHDSDKDSPINSDRGRSLSTDEGNKSAIKPLDALPEGRIPELTVTVNEVNESANERREAELSVTLESGDKVTMVVWSVHDIDASWTVGQRYRLEEVRHKSWSSDGVHNHRLSSSVDLSMTPITDTGDSADSGLDSENDDQNSRIDSMLEDIDFESSS